MGLSEYLIEAVARRTAGKYGYPDNDSQNMVNWLEDNGFKRVTMTFFKYDYEYRIDSIDTEANKPSYITIHTPRYIYSLLFTSKGKVRVVNRYIAGTIGNNPTKLSYDEFAESIKQDMEK